MGNEEITRSKESMQAQPCCNMDGDDTDCSEIEATAVLIKRVVKSEPGKGQMCYLSKWTGTDTKQWWQLISDFNSGNVLYRIS